LKNIWSINSKNMEWKSKIILGIKKSILRLGNHSKSIKSTLLCKI